MRTEPTRLAWFPMKFRVVAAWATPSSWSIVAEEVAEIVFPDMVTPLPAVKVFCFAARRAFSEVVSVYEDKALEMAVFMAVVLLYAARALGMAVFMAAVLL